MATSIWLPLLGVAILDLPGGAVPHAAAQGTAVRVVSGTTPDGAGTERWLEMVRRRLPVRSHDSVASIRRPLSAGERSWEELIRARSAAWGDEALAVARPYRPVEPPPAVLVVTGNRGAEDAFTHDATTIGFDLAALEANYGAAELAENAARLDRFFRHEFAHLMQKAWWAVHPAPTDTPLRHALAEIWSEGLGNYHSLSTRWRHTEGRRSPTAAAALDELEPRFVARLAALACAPPGHAAALTADLSRGRFDRKWGALPMALWLEEEPGEPADALRAAVVAGPEGVWDLADRHLPRALADVLREVRAAAERCAGP